jgi:hypothetical protein
VKVVVVVVEEFAEVVGVVVGIEVPVEPVVESEVEIAAVVAVVVVVVVHMELVVVAPEIMMDLAAAAHFEEAAEHLQDLAGTADDAENTNEKNLEK